MARVRRARLGGGGRGHASSHRHRRPERAQGRGPHRRGLHVLVRPARSCPATSTRAFWPVPASPPCSGGADDPDRRHHLVVALIAALAGVGIGLEIARVGVDIAPSLAFWMGVFGVLALVLVLLTAPAEPPTAVTMPARAGWAEFRRELRRSRRSTRPMTLLRRSRRSRPARAARRTPTLARAGCTNSCV